MGLFDMLHRRARARSTQAGETDSPERDERRGEQRDDVRRLIGEAREYTEGLARHRSIPRGETGSTDQHVARYGPPGAV